MTKEIKKTKNTQLSKKVKHQGIHEVKIYINATKNNTKVGVTDGSGNALFSVRGGTVGPEGSTSKFKNSRKGTPFAAQKVLTETGQKIRDLGIYFAEIIVKGIGAGRESSALQCLLNSGIRITRISDATKVQHGGCRSPAAKKF